MKNLLNLGEVLSKKEQQTIHGGHNCINGCPTHREGCKCVNGTCYGPAYCHR